MTCIEFRKICDTQHPLNLTRGMRAAVIAHSRHCEACYLHVVEASKRLIQEDPAKAERVLLASVVLLNEDLQDQEFTETIFSEKKS